MKYLWVTSIVARLQCKIISDYGIYHSFPKLERNLLSFCSLTGSNISNEGASALAGALQVNENILTLKWVHLLSAQILLWRKVATAKVFYTQWGTVTDIMPATPRSQCIPLHQGCDQLGRCPADGLLVGSAKCLCQPLLVGDWTRSCWGT